jgi:hypothetical protein
MVTTEFETSERYSQSLSKRYSNAYRVSGFFTFAGGFTQVAGFIVAILLLAGGFAAYNSNQAIAIAAAGAAIPLGVGSFVTGMLISAQGQMLRASIDTAINTSPFLTVEQRAQIMSL